MGCLGKVHLGPQEHCLIKALRQARESKKIVSKLYTFFLEKSYVALPVDASRRADIPDLHPDFSWDGVWETVEQSSRNPDHQQVHLNFIHRTYMTPRKLCSMKLKDNPNCTLCFPGTVGTFFHMIWEWLVATRWKPTHTLGGSGYLLS